MPIKALPITEGANIATEEVGLSTHGASLINFYVDSNNNLVRWPGLVEFCDLATSNPVDGLHWWRRQGVVLSVSNGKTLKITDDDGNYSDITGDEFEKRRLVSFSPWVTDAYGANGGRMIQIPSSGNTSYIADNDAPTTVTHLGEIDKYLVAVEEDTERFWYPVVNDPSDWQGGFASAEAKFDLLKTVGISNLEMLLFGTNTTEVWATTGSSTAPFGRQVQGFIESGVGAEHSPALCNGVWYWLDNNYQVVRLNGRTPEIFSPTLNTYLRTFGAKSDAIGQYCSFSGENFYILSLPTAGKTIVCDVQKGGWFEIAHWDTRYSRYERYKSRTMCYAEAWQKMLVGDRLTGKVYTLTPGTHTDAGGTQRALCRTRTIDWNSRNVAKESNSLTFYLKRTATPTDLSDVELTIRWRDNGTTHWKTERTINFGAPGKTELSRRISNLGQNNSRQYEIVMHGDSPYAIARIEEDFEYVK
jgi:hypothetical protein